MTSRVLNQDCRYFAGDRPCHPHKSSGVVCAECDHYERIEYRVLIIKLGAPGDVLRTTSILQGLHKKFDGLHLTWCTRVNAVDLLKHNELIDRVLAYESVDSLIELSSTSYQEVLVLDADSDCAQLGQLVKGQTRRGFSWSEKGFVYATNSDSKKWYEMGLWDDLKKANRQTYQYHISKITGLEGETGPVVYRVTGEENAWAEKYARNLGIDTTCGTVVGINTGAGARWEYKKWSEDHIINFIKELKKKDRSIQVVLYGGPEEAERNSRINQACGDLVVDLGTSHTIREFGALVGLSDVFVTGDTLAMHIAIALDKKVIALFGPTSSEEIELYGAGSKVVADLPCIKCYKPTCDVKPTCMDSIMPANVTSRLFGLLRSE